MSSDDTAPPSYSAHPANYLSIGLYPGSPMNPLTTDVVKPSSFRNQHPPNDDIYIAIMGVTGAGKSSLIARLTKQNINIGHNLLSCTQNVDDFTFSAGGHNIHLIDTPGFDDSKKSDRQVLEDIAKWLGESYEQDIKLHAVMYLHRITDNRLGGVALRNLVMFKKLCGPDFFPRVCLITTRWDEVSTSDGIRREEEMIKTDEFWGRMVEGGAYVLRHDGSEKSAMHILDQVLQNHAHDKPSILKVQHELVNEHLRLSETAAGRTFEAELIKQREEHQRQIKQLQKDMQELLEMNERKAADETEKVKNDLERRIQQSFEDQRRLQADFEALHRESVEKVRRMQEQLERQQQEYEAKVEHLEQMKHQITLYKPNDPKAQYLADEINREQQELPKLATTIEIQKGSLQQTVKRLVIKGKKFAEDNPKLVKNLAKCGIGFASAVMRQRQMNKSLSQHNHSFGGPPNPSPMHSFGQRSQGPVVEELDDGEEEANVNAHPSGFGHVKTEAELNADYQKSFYLT